MQFFHLLIFFSILFFEFALSTLSNKYKWTADESVENVRMFGQLIIELCQNSDQKMAIFDEKTQKIAFETKFADNFKEKVFKFAMEHILSDSDKNGCLNLNAVFGANGFVSDFEHSLQSVICSGQVLLNQLNNVKAKNPITNNVAAQLLNQSNNVKAKNPITNNVAAQLMQLVFSFAARLTLTIKSIFSTDESKIDGYISTFISAYNCFSSFSGNNEEFSIFPFKIVSFQNDKQFMVEFNVPTSTRSSLLGLVRANVFAGFSESQKKYLANFKFVRELSNFMLTPYGIYKLLRAMQQKTEFEPSGVYAFLKFHIKEMGKLEQLDRGIKCENVSCFFIKFGADLFYRLTEYADSNIVLEANDRKQFAEFFAINHKCSTQTNLALIQQVFDELLIYYAHAIQLDHHQCKEIVQISVDLKEIIQTEHDEIKPESFPPKSTLAHFLISILNKMHDAESAGKIEKFLNNSDEKIVENEEEPLKVLNEIIELYKCKSDECPALKYPWKTANFEGTNNIQIFAQILTETFRQASSKVELDRGKELLTIPQELFVHFLERLNSLMNSENCNCNVNIGDELDFIQTLKNVVLSSENAKIVRRRKTIPKDVNAQLFALLFSMSIRSAMQMDFAENLAENYLKTLIAAYKCVTTGNEVIGEYKHKIFEYIIYLSASEVKINIPNWKNSNGAATDDVNIKNKSAKKNFQFLLAFFELAPLTPYEALKILKEMLYLDSKICVYANKLKALSLLVKRLKGINDDQFEGSVLIKEEFCTVAYFGQDLWRQIEHEGYAKQLDSYAAQIIEPFLKRKLEMCRISDKSKNLEIFNNFGEQLINYSRVLNFDFDPSNDLLQVAKALSDRIEEMLAKSHWSYSLVKVMRIEWNLLQLEVQKVGMIKHFMQIDALMGEWRKIEDANLPKGEAHTNATKYAQIMRGLVSKLKEIIEKIEDGEVINDF